MQNHKKKKITELSLWLVIEMLKDRTDGEFTAAVLSTHDDDYRRCQFKIFLHVLLLKSFNPLNTGDVASDT